MSAETATRAFCAPRKCIADVGSLARFKRSSAYRTILTFITDLSDTVVGQKLRAPRDASAPAQALLRGLDEMGGWVDEIPPIQQAMRYGNAAFKTWHARLVERAAAILIKASEDGAHVTAISAKLQDASSGCPQNGSILSR